MADKVVRLHDPLTGGFVDSGYADIDGGTTYAPKVVSGATAVISGAVTRPADTTQYTANDGVTNSTTAPVPISFLLAARVAAGSGWIRTATLRKSTNVVTVATFRMHLFDVLPTAPNDNAAYSLALTDMANKIGFVDFNAPIAGSDCVWYVGTLYPDVIAFKLAAGTTIFGVLQALGAYAPGSAEVFTSKLRILQD